MLYNIYCNAENDPWVAMHDLKALHCECENCWILLKMDVSVDNFAMARSDKSNDDMKIVMNFVQSHYNTLESLNLLMFLPSLLTPAVTNNF